MVEKATSLGADVVINIRYFYASVVGGATEMLCWGMAVKFVD
jgi:uncharacterized protein YbjQ (UPF0145 family)